jgi:hypothetical protein
MYQFLTFGIYFVPVYLSSSVSSSSFFFPSNYPRSAILSLFFLSHSLPSFLRSLPPPLLFYLTLLTSLSFPPLRHPYVSPLFGAYRAVIPESSKSFLILLGAVCVVGETVILAYPNFIILLVMPYLNCSLIVGDGRGPLPWNLRIYEFTNLRIYEFTNLRIYEFTNLRICEFTNNL